MSTASMDVERIVQVLMQQRDQLFAYLWTMIRDVQLAEDVLQELSILAVKKGGEADNEEGLVLWLRQAARLKALETLRSRGRLPVMLSDDALDQLCAFWSAQPAGHESGLVDALRACLETLTPNNRRILALRYVDGKKSAEIANVLGRKVEAIYKAIARIHAALRQCVEGKRVEACENE